MIYKGPVMKSVDAFLVICLYKMLNKPYSSLSFETPWRLYDVTAIGFGDYTDLLWWMWFKQLVLPIDH